MGFHLSKAGFFIPILEELRQRGSNTDNLLRRSNLYKFDLADPENYVPAHFVYSLFDAICTEQGNADILEDFAQVLEVTSLAQFGEIVAYAPDLLSTLQLAKKYVPAVNTQEVAGFFIDGNKTTYWQKFIDAPDQRGRGQAEQIALAYAMHTYRLAAGKDSAPLEIHLQSDTSPNLDLLLTQGCNTRVLLGQSATALVFKTSLLAAPMLPRDSIIDPASSVDDISGLSAKTECLLNALVPGQAMTLNRLSQMMDIAPRTLQRRFQEEGKTLSQLVEQWRMKSSLDLLQTTEMTVKEISERLGYSDVSNFKRAFRRWTHSSPNRYRKSLDSPDYSFEVFGVK